MAMSLTFQLTRKLGWKSISGSSYLNTPTFLFISLIISRPNLDSVNQNEDALKVITLIRSIIFITESHVSIYILVRLFTRCSDE
jgi:hypothetical protein